MWLKLVDIIKCTHTHTICLHGQAAPDPALDIVKRSI